MTARWAGDSSTRSRRSTSASPATASSFLTVFSTGSPRPVASNLNFGAGQTVPNLVVVKVSADGWLDFSNAAGTVDVVADIQGWFA